MKKVLITMHSMHIGGIETSLIGLLNAFDYTRIQVSLMVFQHQGELMPLIPKEVRLLSYDYRYDVYAVPLRKLLFSRNFMRGVLKIISRLELNFLNKFGVLGKGVWSKTQYLEKYLMPFFPNIKGEYDLCLAFSCAHAITINKVNAKVKAGWIHTDYDKLTPVESIDINNYSRLDYIVTVSEGCQTAFLNHYPQFLDKTIVIENVLSKEFIHEQSVEQDVEKEMPANNGEVRLLSIGRFGHAKNFDNIPEICRSLIELGCKIKWYIVGYGNDEQLILDKINELGMSDLVIILGKKENPYPYIKACDIYIQPSRYEGKAVTVREAQLLGKPVVITDFATSQCQLRDAEDGIIVPMDNKKCADGIAGLINDSSLRSRLIQSCLKGDYANQSELSKIYRLMEI